MSRQNAQKPNPTTDEIKSFVEFPPRQTSASFDLECILEKMQEAIDGSLH